jgi:Protein of unknown function (DUF1488)
MEAAFFVNQDALRRIEPGIGADEAGFLGAFDSHCDLIHAAAVKIYGRARKGSYELIAADFWLRLCAGIEGQDQRASKQSQAHPVAT